MYIVLYLLSNQKMKPVNIFYVVFLYALRFPNILKTVCKCAHTRSEFPRGSLEGDDCPRLLP